MSGSAVAPKTVRDRRLATPPWSAVEVTVVALVVCLSAVLVWPGVLRGWFPWDDGVLAQTADRVLHGQLPHRDFDDPYSGGFALIQAGLFRLFGTTLVTLRVPIFLVWLLSVAIGVRLARRFVGPAVAGAMTLAWVVWSMYAWPFPLLNWFYAPLVLSAVWATTRYVESARCGYLVVAGAIVGTTITFKVSGLYALAAFLLWGAADVALAANITARTARNGFAAIVGVASVALVLLVEMLVRGMPAEVRGSAEFAFVLPVASVAIVLTLLAKRSGLGALEGLRAFSRLMVPFAIGLALTLGVLLVFYATQHALGDLFLGLFVRPTVRLSRYWAAPPGRLVFVSAMLAPAVLMIGARSAVNPRPRLAVGTALALGAIAGGLSHFDQFTATSAALMVRSIGVAVPLILVWTVVRREVGSAPYASIMFLLVAQVSMSQLLQVPWASLLYALYAVPLAVLALTAVVGGQSASSVPAGMLLCSFMMAAGIGHPATSLEKPAPERWARLAVPRGGIWVSPSDSARIAQVVAVLARRPPGPIHVVGDAPEYAFLTARLPASRVTFDALADSSSRDARNVLALLRKRGVETVILLNQFGYNDSVTMLQVRALRTEFPEGTAIGEFVVDGGVRRRFLEIRWRQAPRN